MNPEHREKQPDKTLHKNRRILVVEDNSMNQKLVGFLLNDLGYDYKISPNGHDAIESARREDFGLVLMDLELPLLNGYEATHKIRYELRLNIPIIAMTAHDHPDEKTKCLAAGMNNYISKPVNKDLLQELLKKYL